MLREVPGSDDSDPEFEDISTNFPPPVEIHADSDPEFEDSEDVFADVARPKPPSQAAPIIIRELDAALPGFIDAINIFEGETLEDKLRNGIQYKKSFYGNYAALQDELISPSGSNRNPAEYVMSSNGFTARTQDYGLPMELEQEVFFDIDRIKNHFHSLQRVLSSEELTGGLSRIIDGSPDFSRDVRLLAGFRALAGTEAVRNNPNDARAAARDSIGDKGISFVGRSFSSSNRTIAQRLITQITLPKSMVETSENLEMVNDGLQRLTDFFKGKSLPNNLKNTEIIFTKDGKETADLFYTLHPNADRTEYSPERMEQSLGFNAASDPGLPDWIRVVVINPEALKNIGSNTNNFGATPAEATLVHEYAHSIKKSISNNWGTDGDKATEAYRAIWENEKDISEYANESIQEHFAENFARYVLTGEASDAFKKYLDETAGIRELNTRDFTHPTMGASEELEQQLNRILNSNDNSPVSFEFSISAPSYSIESIEDMLQRGETPRSANSRSVTIEVIPKDGSGRRGTINTTFRYIPAAASTDGEAKFEIDATLFELPNTLQGQDIAKGVVLGMGEYVKALGGGRVYFTAGLTNGPYAWAEFGLFKPDANFIAVNNYKNITQRYLPAAEWWRSNQDFFSSLTDDQKILAINSVAYQTSLTPEQSSSFPDGVVDKLNEYVMMVNSEISSGRMEEIDAYRFFAAALQNGWTLTQEDIDDMRNAIAKVNADVIPFDFAKIGKNSRAESAVSLGFGENIFDTAKKGSEAIVSSLGRIIMMSGGGWRGYIELRPNS